MEALDLADEEIRDPFDRFVAIMIVLGTLVAALVGFFLTSAGRNGDRAAVQAARLAVRAMGGLVRAQQLAQVDYETFGVASQQRSEAQNAFQRFLFTPVGEDRIFELAEQRFEKMARRTDDLTALRIDSPDGPRGDPIFPNRYFARSRFQPERLAALQDAAVEEDGGWDRQQASLTAVLTMLAVALYLFGLSLAVKVAGRRLLAGVGVVLLTVGSVWSTFIVLDRPERAPNDAAQAFADGRVGLFTAAGREDFRTAIDHFSRAIELRPTFARAYEGRALATIFADSPQTETGALISLNTPEALRSAIADFEKARELGIEDSDILLRLGFDKFQLGLITKDRRLLEESIDDTSAAIELRPGLPVLRYNLGVALLALDRPDEARAAYREGNLLTIYRGGDPEKLRDDASFEESVVAGALTDLELLLRHREDLADQVRSTKEFMVGAVSRQEGEFPDVQIAASSVEVDLFPAEVQWRAALDGFDPTRDVLTAEWYYQDPEQLGWGVLPTVSYLYANEPGGPNEEGQLFELSSYLATTFPSQCVPDGSYRIELYVNGRFAGQGEGAATFGGLDAVTSPDLNVALCRPADWVRSEAARPGFVDGYVSPNGDRGAFFLRLQDPAGATDDPATLSSQWINFSIENFGQAFPAQPVFDSESTLEYFLGLAGPVTRFFTYGENGQVFAGAGVASDRAVIVGLVFGPQPDFIGDPGLFDIFDSMIELNRA